MTTTTTTTLPPSVRTLIDRLHGMSRPRLRLDHSPYGWVMDDLGDSLFVFQSEDPVFRTMMFTAGLCWDATGRANVEYSLEGGDSYWTFDGPMEVGAFDVDALKPWLRDITDVMDAIHATLPDVPVSGSHKPQAESEEHHESR